MRISPIYFASSQGLHRSGRADWLRIEVLPIRPSHRRNEKGGQNSASENRDPHHLPVDLVPATIYLAVNQDRKHREVGEQGDRPSPSFSFAQTQPADKRYDAGTS